jgi:SRSO17 transposase
LAARIAPGEVGAKHQSLYHFVAKAPWDEAELLSAARTFALPKIEKEASIRAWIIDDTSIPKKGEHSASRPCRR